MNTQSKKRFNILSKLIVALIAVVGLIAVATPAFAQSGVNPLSVTVDRNYADDRRNVDIKNRRHD